MKLLVVDDQESTLSHLEKGLRESGFTVDTAATGDRALASLQVYSYDLLIVDGFLPDIDGWTLVRMVRKFDRRIPILFLSASDRVEDKVKGLECGADCYLVKPFTFAELLAQIRSLIRRKGFIAEDDERSVGEHVLRIDDLVIDALSHKVYRGSKRLDLTAKEFSLLTLLARRRGEILSRALIAEQVWDVHFDFDSNVVDVHIRRLRAKVDEPFERKLIRTVRGFGYSLA